MAKFKHITPQDWEWMTIVAANVRLNQGCFNVVRLTGEQYCRIVDELSEIDRSDVRQFAAAVAASKTLKARKTAKTRKSVKG